MLKNLFISIILVCSLSASSFAGYIKFGNALSSTEGATGNIDNLDFGIYSIKKFTLGISLENGLYSDSGYYGKIKKVIDFANTANFDNLYDDLNKVKGFTTVTNTFATVMYDYGAPRGLYFTGGVGYGVRAKIKGSVGDMAYLASSINKGKTPEQLMADPKFQAAVHKLAQNPSDLINLIKQVAPNSGDLISQVDTKEKIENLLNDESALNNFINDAQSQNFDSSSMDKLNSLSAFCNTLITCDYGMAYTLGVGYDLPVWDPMGIDFQAKSRYMAHNKPIYSLGANVIFRW